MVIVAPAIASFVLLLVTCPLNQPVVVDCAMMDELNTAKTHDKKIKIKIECIGKRLWQFCRKCRIAVARVNVYIFDSFSKAS